MNAAIERLYEMFSSYKLRLRIEGCSCCVSSKQEHQFHICSLRQLTPEALSTYAFKAMTTWGDDYDFKHFLPRILELTVRSLEFDVDVEIVFGKLDYAGWRSWRANEREAIENYLQLAWSEILYSEPRWDQSADSWLCAIGQAIDDMEPYLKICEQSISILPVQNVSEFIWTNRKDLVDKGILFNPFWESHPLQMQQVIAWILCDETIKAYSDALDSLEPGELFDALALLVHCGLQPLRAAHLPK